MNLDRSRPSAERMIKLGRGSAEDPKVEHPGSRRQKSWAGRFVANIPGVRTFTFVGGGSDKFWEIDRDGVSVTVRFGRTGTNGQTQVKELADEATADAHVARLVAEKLAKGYTETTEPSPTVAAARTAQAAAVEPAVAIASVDTPIAEVVAAADPEAKTPITANSTPDEDTWEVPASWWRQVAPFRGRGPIPDTKTARKPGPVRHWMQPSEGFADPERALAAAFDSSGNEPRLLAAAREERAQPGSNALGAAVVAAVLGRALAGYGEDGRRLADSWVAERGLPFAAEAVACLAAVHTYQGGHWSPTGKYILTFPRHHSWAAPTFEGALQRMRLLLAAADDDSYNAAIDRLADVRPLDAEIRCAASYLAPTRQDWVSADTAEIRAGGQREDIELKVLASATTLAQVRDVLDVVPHTWRMGRGRDSNLVLTMATHVGPELAPVLWRIYDEHGAAEKKQVVGILSSFPTDEAFGLLLANLDQKYVQPAVLDAMKVFPRRALRMLASAATGTGAKASIAKELLRDHAARYPDLVEELSPDQTVAAATARVARPDTDAPVAGAEGLPPLLVTPPWKGRKATTKPLVVPDIPWPAGPRLVWLPGEREEWKGTEDLYNGWGTRYTEEDWRNRIRHAGRDGYGAAKSLMVLAHAPERLAREHLLSDLPLGDLWYGLPSLKRILGRFDLDAVEFVVEAASSAPSNLAGALLPIESRFVAAHMAEWLVRAKSVRPVAREWLLRHPEFAAHALMPTALGKPGKARSAAEHALRFLGDRGSGEVVRAAAAKAGPDAAAWMSAFLATDPVEVLPARMPTLPSWLDPAYLPRIRVAAGVLPPEAASNLLLMLALCAPGETYAGLTAVLDELDPASRAEFAWAVFERWRGAGYPSAQGWVLEGLALLGNDDTVRELAPLIRVWPGESAHKRAVAGLDVLSAIGTDTALLHLHRIAEKAAFKGLKTSAREKIDEVAAALELSPDQLADRLVPSLGLDARGNLDLDYGPRRFRVGLDEQLKPLVRDEDGARRKDLPKPTAKDDEALASEAYARFSVFKKELKGLAADQIRRLERAMVTQRSWTAEEYRSLFVEHPLMRHLARRLVWVASGPDATASFRVAEDGTFADGADAETELPADASVRIAHPIDLDADLLAAWTGIFVDYEILQPFPQLAREVFTMTVEELASGELRRYEGLVVPTGRVLGLSHRGWERGDVEDGGVAIDYGRDLGNGGAVFIGIEPGIPMGMAMEWPEQKLVRVGFDTQPPLSAIAASELLRDLEMLRG